MPELPEVETILRGIKPHLNHQIITNVIIRHHQLRFSIPKSLPKNLMGKKIKNISRRGKYLLFEIEGDKILLLHLGMSGHIKILKNKLPPKKHDHVDIEFSNHYILRFNDPRRFGALILENAIAQEKSLLNHLGPEPLTQKFNVNYLFPLAQKSKAPIKSFIMSNKVVVGVGNIYATEALFLAKIHPNKIANTLKREQVKMLVSKIKKVLQAAIKLGGTSLKDFVNSEGKPGYFINRLNVYGRATLACRVCKHKLVSIRLGQRATVFCPHCQPM